ncbi:hypothetical protein B0H11DRAFT_1338534 [Mycena galericulata]|nr:hypothetical protein B0H11DRAFT_1338534 [Mycena galericulata]
MRSSCRDNDGDYVEKLATEIWVACWSLCKPAELRRLSLTCRYFRTLCQPLLFRRQMVVAPHDMVDRHNWIKVTMDLHNRAEGLNQLAVSPHAASVREWLFMGDRASVAELLPRLPLITNIRILADTWSRLVTIFTTTLGAYRQMTELCLDNITVDPKMWAALESLDLLEEVSLRECEIVVREGPLLRLQRFILSGWDDFRSKDECGQLDLVAPQTLQRLTVGGLIEGKLLLSTLIRHSLPHLSYLSVTLTMRNSELVFALLNSCPQLESIRIHYGEFRPKNLPALPDRLPSAAIPLLKSFTGPFKLARLFVRDRPVENVLLSRSTAGTEEVLSTLTAICHGSTPLLSLSIEPALHADAIPEVLTAIGSFFPELRILSIELIDEEREFSDTVTNDEDEDDSGSEDEIDARIVELPEGEMAATDREAGAAPPALEDNKLPELSELPEQRLVTTPVPSRAPLIELPGYMYIVPLYTIHPPNSDQAVLDDDSSPLAIMMDFIYTGRIVLPSHLEVLRFSQPPAWLVNTIFENNEQHRAILALEALLPGLYEVAFGDHQNRWVRDRHVWVRDREASANGRRGNPGARIISSIWDEAGMRRTT